MLYVHRLELSVGCSFEKFPAPRSFDPLDKQKSNRLSFRSFAYVESVTIMPFHLSEYLSIDLMNWLCKFIERLWHTSTGLNGDTCILCPAFISCLTNEFDLG